MAIEKKFCIDSKNKSHLFSNRKRNPFQTTETKTIFLAIETEIILDDTGKSHLFDERKRTHFLVNINKNIRFGNTNGENVSTIPKKAFLQYKQKHFCDNIKKNTFSQY